MRDSKEIAAGFAESFAHKAGAFTLAVSGEEIVGKRCTALSGVRLLLRLGEECAVFDVGDAATGKMIAKSGPLALRKKCGPLGFNVCCCYFWADTKSLAQIVFGGGEIS